MAYKSKDGSEFTNASGMRHHNLRIDAGAVKMPGQPADGGQDEPKDIHDDPEAMECISKLKDLGYTAEDVESAMNEESEPSGQEATMAAGKGLPSIGS